MTLFRSVAAVYRARMRFHWVGVGAIALLALGACGNDDAGERKEPSAGGGYDKAAYCTLVKEAVDRDSPDLPDSDGDLTPEAMKELEASFAKELAFSQKVADAAPEELSEEWQSLVDVQAAVAENAKKFLDPDYAAAFKKKSEDERMETLFTEMLGPFEKLDEKDMTAIGEHADSECGVKDLFDSE